MKKLLILTILLFHICAYSQKNVVYELGKLQMEIDEYSNTFQINQIDTSDNPVKNGHISPIFIYEPYSKGRVFHTNNKIILFDLKLKRYYIFIEIDQYTLKSTKSTAIFKNGDLLKAYTLSNKEGVLIRSMSWKNNKRHGLWSYFFADGISKVNYNNGVPVDSVFQTWKSINKNYGIKE